MLIVLISTSVFLFAEGPFWTHLWDLPRIDRAIWYSYAAVPILVLIALMLERRLGWGSLAIGTLETTAYKFGATFVIAHAAWSFAEPAPRPHQTELPPHVERKLPPPSIIDPSQTGEIRGVAAPGSLVWIESGLEHLVFAPSDRPLLLSHDGTGFAPLSIVQAGQPIDVVSRDGRIHTMRARDPRGVARRNLAVVPTQAHAIPFERALGELEIDCTVHREEARARLIVLGHPFFAQADSSGAFSFTGVPAGNLRLAAEDRGTVEVELRAGEAIDVSL